MRLAQIPNRVSQLAEEYEVPERLADASKQAYHHLSVAGDAARRGALDAYRTALEHPRASLGGVIVAAALVGGVLWYVFGDWRRRPAQRRHQAARVRARTERRKPRQGRV